MASKKPAPKKKPAEPAPRPSRKAKPKKLGRPPKKPSEKKTAQIRIVLREDQRAAVDRAALASGQTLTAFVLEAIERHITFAKESR